MISYSKGDKMAMSAAFKKLWNVDDRIVATNEIVKWMEDAPTAIVEFDGTLPREKGKQRDRRMELYEVYDGNISTLVNYLRDLFPQHKSLSKWELIFTVVNDCGILKAKKSIEQAELQVMFGKQETSDVASHDNEERVNSQASSNEEASVGQQSMVEDTQSESVPDNGENNETPSEEVKPHVEVETPTTDVSEKTEEVSASEVMKPSGNVHETDGASLFNKENNILEDTKMASVDDLLKAADAAKGTSNPAEAQKMPTESNLGSVKADKKEAEERVAKMLGDQKEQRNAWTRANVVTAVVSTQKPAALRTLATEGVVTDETDEAKITEAVNGKIGKYISAVSGKAGITIEQFEALTDAEKYANVAKPEQLDRARAIYELYKQIKQNPTGKYAAFIPGADKVSYPTKGYVIGDNALPVEEFIVQVLDNSTGIVYGVGSVDAQGNDIGDNAVTFGIAIAKRQEKAVSTGITSAKKETRVPVVRPKNKRTFLEDPSHIVYLFTKEDDESTGKANFKAAVNVNGAMESATVSVFALENGQKVQRGTDKDGNPTYKTKVASCNVSVPVKKIVKSFEARFRGDEDITVTAGRWGVNMTVKAQKGNFGNITEFSASPAFDVFADVYAGNVSLSSTLKGSRTIAALKAASDQQAAEEAQASAEDLA